ncbi:hypothetical protein WJX75_005052 [Coccomyxa subellipsoidea]|uniref:Uncharacterized protein n=1 Tax=Coccomyxa subellipsoidea TaxID=248742 RepID=A0ABR2YMR8_9CHLO
MEAAEPLAPERCFDLLAKKKGGELEGDIPHYRAKATARRSRLIQDVRKLVPGHLLNRRGSQHDRGQQQRGAHQWRGSQNPAGVFGG